MPRRYLASIALVAIAIVLIAAILSGRLLVLGSSLILFLIAFFLIEKLSQTDRRICPQCDRPVTVGLLACDGCGYSFVQTPPGPSIS